MNMAKEIATQQQSAVATQGDKNWAEEYGAESFQSNITGLLLKFNKGEWLAGQDEEEIPLGTELVAAAHMLQSGWLRWQNDRPAETIMGYRREGFRPPPRETLGYENKVDWEERKEQKVAPWKPSDMVLKI